MKVGLSYSRCVRDIVEKRVDIEDVLVIISRTDFDPREAEQWAEIWRVYRTVSRGQMIAPEWSEYGDEDEDRFRSVSLELWESGKLFQPRQYGAYPHRPSYHWLETILRTEELENNPSVKLAWDQFQVVAGLANPKTSTLYSQER